MCLAAVPAYLLARMLCPRRSRARRRGRLTIAIPAMSYATSIIPEPLAYLWFALAAWLAVRALAAPRPRRRRRSRSPRPRSARSSRKEFVVLPGRGRCSRRRCSGCSPGRRASALGARLAARRSPRSPGSRSSASLFNWLVVERDPALDARRSTSTATRSPRAALAAGALAIGLGMLPVIGGLASLALPERRGEPAYRAFAAYLAASVADALWSTRPPRSTYLAGSEHADRGAQPLLPLAAPAAAGPRSRSARAGSTGGCVAGVERARDG